MLINMFEKYFLINLKGLKLLFLQTQSKWTTRCIFKDSDIRLWVYSSEISKNFVGNRSPTK